jgi:phosphoglycolate phosphatase-like HAD superfamily hydrolase
VGEVRLAVHTLLVLWDIDHTLTENHGVNKEIYAYAFELLVGCHAKHEAQTDGRTEPEIMQNMLLAHGLEPTPTHFERMLDVLESATVAKAADLAERGHELPGARDALAALRGTPGIIQSVLSGNIKPNAITKLSTFGLDGYIDFEVGGYGSDDSVRDKLVAFARNRASAKYSVQIDKTNTVLIGDTLRDVRAGRNGGAHVVGVATGPDSMDALSREGADFVFPDLRDTCAVVEAVTGFAR